MIGQTHCLNSHASIHILEEGHPHQIQPEMLLYDSSDIKIAWNGLKYFFFKKITRKAAINMDNCDNAVLKISNKFNRCDFATVKEDESNLHSTKDVTVLTF